ncbi:MAG: hypothetical protein IPK16_10985 [Anaerolineales bacterium]|nr:hypothetical protein [Anaerolineales bacterium]
MTVDTCEVDPTPAPVPFWIGDAYLEIGFDATQPETSFRGNIDGVLIDPLDSKPPTSIKD